MKWQFYGGPVEGPDMECLHKHHHCMVRCLNRNVTRTMAREALSIMLAAPVTDVNVPYTKEVSNVWNYLLYIFKGETEWSKEDIVIKDTAQSILEEGTVATKNEMKKRLVVEYGPGSYNKKYKTGVDTYCEVVTLRPEMEIISSKNPENAHNMLCALLDYTLNIKTQISDFTLGSERPVATTYKFIGSQIDETVGIILCLSILPMLKKRIEGDELPSLYLWGASGSGKSYMFTSSTSFKKVPQDATGVGRFRTDGIQSAFLFDDMKASFINDGINSATVRQLCTGAKSTVKIFGDTMDVLGFVVVTSNDRPEFLDDNTDNAKAWKRRFITVNMKTPYTPKYLLEDNLDFYDNNVYITIAKYFLNMFDSLSDKMKLKFKPYYDDILVKYELTDFDMNHFKDVVACIVHPINE